MRNIIEELYIIKGGTESFKFFRLILRICMRKLLAISRGDNLFIFGGVNPQYCPIHAIHPFLSNPVRI